MKSGSRRIANKQHLISLVVWCVCTRKRQWSTILPLRDKYQCVVARNDTGRKERLKTRICTLFLSTSPPFYRLPPLAFMVFSISGRIGLVRDRATTTTTAITSQIQSLMHTSTSSVSHMKFFLSSGCCSHYLSIFMHSIYIGRLSNSQVCSVVPTYVYSMHCIQRKLYENIFWCVSTSMQCVCVCACKFEFMRTNMYKTHTYTFTVWRSTICSRFDWTQQWLLCLQHSASLRMPLLLLFIYLICLWIYTLIPYLWVFHPHEQNKRIDRQLLMLSFTGWAQL